MLFKSRFWPGLADGTITLTFRRWRRAQARAGGTYRTPAGLLQVDDVRLVDPADIRAADAKRAGYPSVAALRGDLGDGDGAVYRVRLRRVGDDPRVALRVDARLAPEEWSKLAARLERLDRASAHGPWTARVLRLIAERPGVRAGDLATAVGQARLAFKLDVRKLKELGLTESLEVGYRLSPRGHAALRLVARGITRPLAPRGKAARQAGGGERRLPEPHSPRSLRSAARCARGCASLLSRV